MRVAFITARPPYPLNTGGKIRTFHLLHQVSRVHDVTLVTAAQGKQDETALAALRDAIGGLAIRAVTVPPRGSPWRRPVQTGRSLCGPLPYTWAAYCGERFRDHVHAVLRDAAFDLVHCDHVQAAPVFGALDTPPRLLHAHNIESVLIRRAAEHAASPWKRSLLAWQYTKTVRAEAAMHRCFDHSVVVSDVDRVELERISPGCAASVVPNGVDQAWLEPLADTGRSSAMAFVGSMDWLPNIDGARFFADAVLPRIRRQIPEAELWVVGRTPPPSLVRRWREAGIQVTGTVDDVRPFVARAALVVVPLRIGGGTRLKILEAWAVRKAVLSTTIGAEGLPAVNGDNIALADTPEEMAACAVSLLRNPGEAARLGAAGRRVVEEEFTWPRVASRLLQAYEETVARACAGARSTLGATDLSALAPVRTG